MIPDIPKELRKEVYDKLEKKYMDSYTSYKQAKTFCDWRFGIMRKNQDELREFIKKYGKYNN